MISSNGAVVTTLKKHVDLSINVLFDTVGGSECSSLPFVIGSTYQELPEASKYNCIFNGWYTLSSGGQKIDASSNVEVSNLTLYAQWEEVNISGDFTSYQVEATESYKKTGIYQANRYDSTSSIYIDWGDGGVEKINGNISQLSHSYETSGIYVVKISNNINNFAANGNSSTWYNTTSTNRYTFKKMLTTGSNVANMPTYAFYYCAAMDSIDWL